MVTHDFAGHDLWVSMGAPPVAVTKAVQVLVSVSDDRFVPPQWTGQVLHFPIKPRSREFPGTPGIFAAAVAEIAAQIRGRSALIIGRGATRRPAAMAAALVTVVGPPGGQTEARARWRAMCARMGTHTSW